MEQVQSKLREQLASKKYLLVLDDVWTENRDHWCNLAKYLIGDKRGSWIVVTTRSQKTATITGGLMHELSGLSKENSWNLFQRTAFASNQPNPVGELVEIGQKIVDGCTGVPLAIKVAGSLLYGQDKSKWLSVQKIGLANIRDEDNGIMPILKLSFYHLESPLKNCFQYCALFPKDFVMEKQLLISLWMAQGYIVPLDKFQSIEDAGEEYFSILLRRCFFQDIKRIELGEITLCKIHDLMHDIAQNVSGKEIYAVNAINGNVHQNVRHLSFSNMREYEKYYCLGKIRSLLCFQRYNNHCQLAMEALVGSFRCLRVLDLCYGNIKCLPKSIGELLHLRWLDLSGNVDMEVLPNSITKLYNLESLILLECKKLKELPKDLSRLVKLRELDIESCNGLTYMPRGMGKLTCLRRLRGFYKVGGEEGCKSWKQWFDDLEDLKALYNLRGELRIFMLWPKSTKNVVVKEDTVSEGLYLRNMEHLNHIWLHFNVEEDSGRLEHEEGITMRLMEGLQPHSNLKMLRVEGYHGVKMPGWVTLLPHLVKLRLIGCKELKYLPYLGNLCNLKSLYLGRLLNLEYIEEYTTFLPSTVEEVSLFPSLEHLFLDDLPKLKGWRRGVGMEESSNSSSNNPHLQHQNCLFQLKNLTIYHCPELVRIMLCPSLETLELCLFNERLQINCIKNDEKVSEAGVENHGNSGSILVPKLKKVTISNGAWLNLMPMESFHGLQSLYILEDYEMEDLPNSIQHLSALQYLRIQFCRNLKAMPNWMPKLTSLRELVVFKCSERLKERCKKDPPGEDWPYIQHIPHIRLDVVQVQNEC